MDVKDLEKILRETRQRRGYLLPHHGLMALALPGMLEDYDRLYSSVAVRARHLDDHAREFIWLAVLAARDEALGTHHVARFQESDGSAVEVEAAVAIASFVRGAGAFRFAGRHWRPHLPEFDAAARFFEALEKATANTPGELRLLAAAAAFACIADFDGLAWAVSAAYEAGADERRLAEALSLMLLPGSVPNFARAAATWRDLIRSGEVEASPPFAAWAALEGQGGYDEASGRSPEPD